MEPVSEETVETTQDGDVKSPNSNPATAILSGRGHAQQLGLPVIVLQRSGPKAGEVHFVEKSKTPQNETEEVTVGQVKEQLKNLSLFVKENQDDRTW